MGTCSVRRPRHTVPTCSTTLAVKRNFSIAAVARAIFVCLTFWYQDLHNTGGRLCRPTQM